jgi:hypothetical protein
MHHGLHVSELRKLTSLTELVIAYDTGSFFASFDLSVRGLAAVTQLVNLSIYLDNSDTPVADLLPLTALTALTVLIVTKPSDPRFVHLCTDVSLLGVRTAVRTPYVRCKMVGLVVVAAGQARHMPQLGLSWFMVSKPVP